jgi:Ras-related protein Rab-6A
VTLEEATTKATQLNIMFMETSAKAGHNVKSLFKKIAMSLPGMEKETQGEPNTSKRTMLCIILPLADISLFLQKLT